MNEFIRQFSILDYDRVIAEEAAKLKRKYQLTFPDAVIAATAKLFGLVLVSKDKAFKKVKEVKSLVL